MDAPSIGGYCDNRPLPDESLGVGVIAPRSITTWQRALLPFMGAALVVSALFFAGLSVFEFENFKTRIALTNNSLPNVFEQFEKAAGSANTSMRLEYLQWKSVFFLEEETVKHRYAQVNAAILSRMWTRLMGFTTGMVLAVVGAAFILGKLREGQTELRQESELLKLSLVTASPGIVLATLGTILMSITLVTRFDIDIHDVPVYLVRQSLTPEVNDRDPASLLQATQRPEFPKSAPNQPVEKR